MNKHTVTLLISLFALIILSVFLGISITHTQYWAATIILLAIALITTRLIQLYNRRTHDIQRLIDIVQPAELSPTPQRESLDKTLMSFNDNMKQLESNIAFYEMLLNKADFAIIVTDKKDNVIWANKVMFEMTGSSRINKISDLKKVLPDFSLLTKDLLPKEVKSIQLSKEQHKSDLAISMIPAEDRGKKLKIFTIKNIQPLLDQKENEVWKELIRSFTDEMMIFIAPIKTLAETFANEEGIDYEPQMMMKAMRTIHRRSNDLGQLINDSQKLLKISQPNVEKIFVKDIVENIANQLKEKPITFTYVIEPLDIQIEADKEQIEQVLLNIIENAREACSENENPEIKLKVSSEGHHVLISVLDKGCGILPEIKDKLFTPFFTTKDGNTGMGLSICRLIINTHGGTIDVSSDAEKETCVTVKLPS